ncbi:poly(ADP-ribose) polymerase catalytic domain-containing protein [Ditylenchus destructor]|nr:poly(ADP-ribose) polymerase catalytic domain-containing protein [Ditylenchus destructor]
MSAQIRWEYQVSANKWICYTDDITKFLNSADPSSDKCTYDAEDIEFDLKKMRLKSGDGKMEKNFRCVIKAENDEYFAWDFMDGRRYQSFPANVLENLEKGFSKFTLDSSKNETIQIVLNGEKLLANFKSNIMTGSQDAIKIRFRRQQSKGVASAALDSDPGSSKNSVPARGRSQRIAASISSTSAQSSKAIDTKGGNNDDDKDSQPKDITNDSTKNQKSATGKNKKGGKENKRDANQDKAKTPPKRKLEDELNIADESDTEAEIDIECVQKLGKAHVYKDGNDIYDAMLNQTNIQNNNNKYFLMQVLEDDTGKNYSTWFRWGRVGFRGQTNLIPCGSNLEAAIDHFKRKFVDKTKNNFEDRANFEKVTGKYDLIKVDYSKKKKKGNESDAGDKSKKDMKPPLESKLDSQIRHVMELICDLKAMELEIRNMEYDVNKSPLGNITKAQIKAGYEALTKIENFIKAGNFGSGFVDAVNEYYTKIPHYFGMRQPTPIRTIPQLKAEIELLETLCGIEIAVSAINEEMENVKKEKLHPLDNQYFNLNWSFEALDQKSSTFKLIDCYLKSTHGSTHDRYEMKLRNVYELKEKDGLERPFMSELGNRHLLWHGSRISNWYGILSQGLRIAPPEAPVTGYMFGKGVYFADASSKSANYTYPEPGKPGFLVLADVALGNINDLVHADEKANKLPPGKHSVRGMGKLVPNPKSTKTLDDGVKVPCGKLTDNKSNKSLTLQYNEYIVYDTSQIRERFLVEVDFVF